MWSWRQLKTAGSEENSLCCLIQYIDRLVQNAVWIQKVTEKMPKVYLPLKLLPVISKAWCSMTATHTGEVCREIDKKILGKYQTLQKFWSAHIQSNLIILFLGAIVFTDEQNSSSSWQTPQQYVATVQHDTDPFMANWGNRTEVLKGHSLMTQNKNCDAWIMFTYCYLYVFFPGKKSLEGAPGRQPLSLYSMTFAKAVPARWCIFSPPSVFPWVYKTHSVWHSGLKKNLFLALRAIWPHLLFIWNVLTGISAMCQMAQSGPFYFIHIF